MAVNTTIYVDDSFVGVSTGSQTHPFTTIQDAVDAATAGDIVSVAAGNYAENVTIGKALTLQGAGSGVTTITGHFGGPEQGTIYITPGVNNVTIDGFKVIGFDGLPASETGAIYLQGAHDNITITNNNVVANGDAGLMGEFGYALTNILIDGNEFSGQTFSGSAPGGNGFANQFGENSETNVPRQLVVLGTNNDAGTDSPASNITFTNNLISGTAGGISTTENGLPSLPHVQGNTLVTIDATDSIVSDNVFTGFTNRFATQLRVREENTTVTNNEFSNADGGNLGASILTDNEPGIVSGNSLDYGPGDDWIFASAGNDDIDGGGGTNTYDMTAAGAGGGTVDLVAGDSFSTATGADTLANIQNLKGSAGADFLKGDGGSNVFTATTGNDVIDGRGDGASGDTFDASAAATAITVNLTSGAVSGAFTASLTSIENVKTGAGADAITLSSAANAVDGGGDIDTVTTGTPYAGATFGWDDAKQAFTVDGDSFKNVEKLQFSDGKTVWLADSTADLTYALANAVDGDVIKLGKGTFVGSFTISDAVTIESASGVASDVVLSGNFRSLNGMAVGDSVATYLQTHGSYTGVTGLTISHDNVTLKNITISEYVEGIALGTASHIMIDGVDFTSNVTGIRKGTASVVTDFTWTGGTVSDGQHGATIYAAKVDIDPGPGTTYAVAGAFDDVDINGVTFANLNEKGLYFEQLSDAEIYDIDMDHVGQYGRTLPFGGDGTFGAGIDINLKYGSYSGIDIHDFEFTDVGLSNKNGAGSPHAFGGAIVVKARNDGGDYSDPPATLDNVTIHDGTIDGTSTGIRIGEPTKVNAGPTDVIVSNVEVTDAVAEYDNRTTSTLTVNIDTGDQNVSSNSDATGVIAYIDSTTSSTTYTVNSGDTVTENSATGTDTVNARGSFTLGANVENLNLVDAGTGSDNFENFALGTIDNGENGWTVLAGGRDQAVVDLAGNHVFKMSSDPASGDFAGPYSPNIGVTAGEPASTSDGDVHIIKFRVKPVSSVADNSRLEVDTGIAQGTDRNNFMVIESIAGQGLRIAVADPLLNGNWDTDGDVNDFAAFTGNRTLIDGLDTTQWHDIELRVLYRDSADNDVIEVYVDGEKVGETTTFENYRDALGGTHAANAEANQTNRIFFRPSAGGAATDGPGGVNQGFYFDDITNTVTTDSTGTGNALDNVINGNSGHNVLNGLGGNDTIDGGDGNDTIEGGTGVDSISGGKGNDLIKESASDADVIDGGAGTDTLQIDGTSGDDTVVAVYNGASLASVNGGAISNIEAVTLSMAGNTAAGDTLSYSGTTAAVTVNLGAGTASGFASIAGVENVVGGSGADHLVGDGNANVFTGGAGNDTIDGAGGIDTAVFTGNINDYAVQYDGGTQTYAITKVGTSEIDSVTGVEKFNFGGTVFEVSGDPNLIANRFPPVFSSGTAASFDENVANPTVYTAAATDADSAAVFGNIVYSLEGPDAGLFTINSSTGVVRLTGTADFEADPGYAITVRATQGITSSTRSVTLSVNDLNDNNPVFQSGSTASVTENTPASVVVYDANATDADSSTTFGAIAYSLSGTDASAFTIDASTGQVRLNSASDFEAKSGYAFAVTATQGSTATTQNVALAVTNVNEGVPGVLGTTTLTVESGSTKTPVGSVGTAGTTFDVLSVSPGGGTVLNGTTVLAAGQTLTLAQANALTFSSGTSSGSIQLLAHDGVDTTPVTINLVVTAAVNATYTGTNSADRLDGAGGNDSILGKSGADILIGGAGKDTISGGNGKDTIYGGTGRDVLTGGSKADQFVFDTKLSSKQFDTITDFKHGTDKIALDDALFAAIGAKLNSKEFYASLAGKAHDGSDRIIYETDTGKLRYDADGNGTGKAIHFATLSNLATVTFDDFVIV